MCVRACLFLNFMPLKILAYSRFKIDVFSGYCNYLFGDKCCLFYSGLLKFCFLLNPCDLLLNYFFKYVRCFMGCLISLFRALYFEGFDVKSMQSCILVTICSLPHLLVPPSKYLCCVYENCYEE